MPGATRDLNHLLHRGGAGLALVLLLAAALLIASPSVSPSADDGPGAAGVGDRPNIVFILADDQAENSFRRELMPRTFAEIVEPGVRMRRAVAAPPLCCPYRAGFITGQYPHNNGVTSNRPGYSMLRDPANVLPVWLQDSGYETALVGKYLNKTRQVLGFGAAPGWDEWYAIDIGSGYFDPYVDDNGEVRRPGGYVTDVLTDRAVDVIASGEISREPFFLWLSHLAPHGDPSPDRRRGSCAPGSAQPPPGLLRDYRGPSLADVRTPSFNERDVADKPPKGRERPRLDRAERRALARRWRCNAATVQALDDSVGEVMEALRATGQLNETIVIYGSDNGYLFGEHRYAKGKATIYEEVLSVPLAIRVPPGFEGDTPAAGAERRIVTQLDLTAGILDWTRSSPCGQTCRAIDGYPITRLLSEADWGRDRAVLHELYTGCDRGQLGVRTARYSYVGDRRGCERDEVELYDLREDPYQLRNLAGQPSARGLERRLERLSFTLARCAGTGDLPIGPACR